MAYSTYTDVQSEFRDVEFGGSTKITSAEVTEFIVQTDNYINARISEKYVTPVTAGAGALSILKMVSVYYTAARVWNILNEVVSDTKDRGKELLDKAEDMINKILADNETEIKLSGATLQGSGGFVSYTYENDIEPNFEKNEDQW